MSDVVSLHCPKCGRKLKIKDRSLFGKKVACPECKQRFVLNDPDGPEIAPDSSIAESPVESPSAVQQSTPQNETPPQAAQPVPQAPPKTPVNPFDFTKPAAPTGNPFDFLPPKPAAPPTSQPVNPFAPVAPVPGSNPFATQTAGGPGGSPTPPTPFVLPAAQGSPLSNAPTGTATATPPAGQPVVPAASPFVTAPSGSGPLLIGDEPSSITARRNIKKKSNWTGTIAGVVAFLVIAGGAGYYLNQTPIPKPAESNTVASSSADAAVKEEASPPGAYSRSDLEGNPELVAEFLPTKGEPIQLLMVPSGINLVIHLRPALLWSDDITYRILRASLTDDITNWLAQQIRTYCRREPQQIDEVTFGIILGPRGMDPQVCTVVRLKEPARLSDLIEEFPGKYLYEISEKPNLRIKVDEKHAYLIHDDKTFAICPAEMASELEHWITTPNYEVSEGINEQLKQTDRERLLTIIGTVNDLDIHQNVLFVKEAQPLISALLEWVGPDVETIGWSLHPAPYLHSQVWLRTISAKSPMTLEKDFQAQLRKLPDQIWKNVCARMNPAEVRFQQLIGRLPAMLEAYQRSTVSQRAGRLITLTTVLPMKATPNLVLAALFTVNEASRTNFGVANVADAGMKKAELPPTIAGRIELPVDAEFNRSPLEPVLQFLCDEIQVKLFVDGDALKDAGYTKNMPQTFTLGKVPMKQALMHILDTYQETGKQMVACFDEAKMQITITTRKFAERDGLKVSLPLPK
ncbi:hypothetical protein [Planctomicrobium sp. SH527]|uniref:hypothetical protein n=1 Tax=Planctomicrobium sp. SH527 TaxID=3448123 RepID=UPI003F5C1A3D